MKINNQKVKSLALLSLVGSTSAKKGNQSEINLNSLPQMGTNLTSAKITKRDEVYRKVYVAGTPALFGITTENRVLRNRCTGGFAIVKNNDTCLHNDYGGFVTSVFCFPPQSRDSLLPVTSWDGSVELGISSYYYFMGIDYIYVINRTELVPFVPKTTEEGTKDLLPVIASANPTNLGSEVCVYGAVSGYQCGNLTAVNVNLTVPDPYIQGDTWPLNYLGKVDLGTNGLLKEDIGAPVYTETQIGKSTLAQAVGHVTWIDNNDVQHQSFYYTPLEVVLSNIEYFLSFVEPSSKCSYSLLTYNEKNAQEYDQLIAQMEIPVKK